MQVIKRDGTQQEYLGSKIEKAVEQAMLKLHIWCGPEPTLCWQNHSKYLYMFGML